jgi:hypothetical protein
MCTPYRKYNSDPKKEMLNELKRLNEVMNGTGKYRVSPPPIPKGFSRLPPIGSPQRPPRFESIRSPGILAELDRIVRKNRLQRL